MERFPEWQYIPELLNTPELCVESPAIVMYREQLKSLAIGNSIGIVKPWKTDYRGSLFIYVPQKTKKINIQGIERGLSSPAGIYASIDLKNIIPLSKREWHQFFPLHKEIGQMQLKKAYLWLFDSIHVYTHPIQAKLDSYWGGAEWYNKGGYVDDNLRELITPQKFKRLHTVSLIGLGKPIQTVV